MHEYRQLVAEAQQVDRVVTAHMEVLGTWRLTVGCENCRDDVVERTLQAGLTVIRTFQQAHVYVRQAPLFTLEQPHFRIIFVTSLEEFDLNKRPTGFADLGIGTLKDPEQDVPTELQPSASADLDPLIGTMMSLSEGHDRGAYIDLLSSAFQNMYGNRDVSTAVLLAAQVSEYLLDLMLMHVLWWENFTPEDAAREFRPGIVERTQVSYAPRVGGSWAKDRGTIKSLILDVLAPRNRIAHGGRRAQHGEGLRALRASLDLRSFVEKLSNSERVRGKYPLLYPTLAGLAGRLTRRQQAALTEYADERRAAYRFHSWMAELNRRRGEAFGTPMLPSIDHAQLIADITRDGEVSWWLYDPETHYAAELAVAPFAPEDVRQMRESAPPVPAGFESIDVRVTVDRLPPLPDELAWKRASDVIGGPGMQTDCPLAGL